VFLTVFDQASSLGLVQLYYDEFTARLGDAAPPKSNDTTEILAENFESELDRNLKLLFSR